MPLSASRRLEPRPPPPRGKRNAHRSVERPSLLQFVVLSFLLHALVILSLGTPTGGSPDGRATWGSLDVTIRGPLLDSGVGLKLDRSPELRLPGREARESREREPAAPPAPAPPPTPPQPQPDLEAGKVADIALPAPLAPLAPLTPAKADLAPAPRVEPVKADVPVITVPAIDWTPQATAQPAL
ncbi:MAG: hypothetical protein AB7S87_15785, partial [Burkholderiales bacterium]